MTNRLKILIAFLLLTVCAYAATNTTSQNQFSTNYSYRSTGTHANTETVNLKCANAGTCVAGTYEVHANLGVTGATGTGTATLTITASDGTASRTVALSGVNVASTAGFASGASTFDYDGSGTLTSGLVVAGASGSSSFYYNVILRRVR